MGLAGVIAFRWIPSLLALFPAVFPRKMLFAPFDVKLQAQTMSSDSSCPPNYLPGANRRAAHECLTVGGGCFWGLEKMFRVHFPTKLLSTQVGYAGGTFENPTYEDVCTGSTGHFEAVRLCYLKEKTTPEELLEFFWSVHDPTTTNRQGNDVGPQYRSAICVSTQEQISAARELFRKMEQKWGKKLTTEIIEGRCVFWPAEQYHQLYLDKHPGGYCTHKNHFANCTTA